MIIGVVIGIGISLGLFALFFVWQKKQQPQAEKAFEQHAQKALSVMLQEIVKTTRDQLGAEKRDITDSISKDLKAHTDNFKEVAQSLKQEIAERQREIRVLEEDRNKKYGQISQALDDYKSLTADLRGSTEQLKRILASNQLRGSWGELQAGKILEAAGMIEGQHYKKQEPISANPELRPDFTVYLPNSLELYVDVKFPLQALQAAMATDNKGEIERHLQQFGTDIRARMKEAAKYVGKGKSVDYVILFVPSESVFEIMNKHFPALIDSSFSQRVICASPHSFFAIVRTIQESYTHFYYEQNLKEILGYLQLVLQQFEKFKGEFQDVGRALELAQKKFGQLTTTRYNQIDRLTTKINTYQIDKSEVVDSVPLLETGEIVVIPDVVSDSEEVVDS